ncbi:uncharacterized protein EV422DRAFT_322962 [Fimicolochytrium jonesii]|uniref:uncharacterized protein n=1 Tax=Fimicolochytrium jonesii TaxID=1396493 RepID=UPI0022FE66C4|nr:uncharacterized protein EV422DRAFT_322962 [Fimicolochytrium jonesii]KAI8824501.1 hypothetical protein EV422DRAFT_322962 [Fimicolochytrium jonesii]
MTLPVSVLVRVRPNPSLRPPIVTVDETSHSVTLSETRRFTYDAAYGPEHKQAEIWNAAINIVDGVLSGLNGTILAYGQTRSGKTYTMLGSEWSSTSAEDTAGVIPRAVRHIFDKIEENRASADDVTYRTYVSFLEIYQEQVRDLLMPGQNVDSKDHLAIRKGVDGAMSVCGLLQVEVGDMNEALSYLEQGSIARTTGDTQMNSKSSRSHAVFTIILEQRKGETVKISKLSLVDLAGSERLKRTGAEGVRFQESVKINTGLLALGNVISILGSEFGFKKGTFVPYRMSKLTRLLEDSLGGNAKTLLIACVSPAREDSDETLNTLKYAHRARKIQNKPVVNIIRNKEPLPEIIDEDEIFPDPIEPDKDPDVDNEDEYAEGDAGYTVLEEDSADDPWFLAVMDELRHRTSRGLKAQRSLESALSDRDALSQRVGQLEKLLEESQHSIMEMQASSDERLKELLRENEEIAVHAEEVEQECERARQEQEGLLTRLTEVENELHATTETLTTDINLTVDTLIAVLNGEDVAKVVETARGVVKRWRPDSAVCLETSGPKPGVDPYPEHPGRQPLRPSRPPSSVASVPGSLGYPRRRVRKVSTPDQTAASLIDRQHAAIRRLEDDLFEKDEQARILLQEIQQLKEVVVPRLEGVNLKMIVENDRLKAQSGGQTGGHAHPTSHAIGDEEQLSKLSTLLAQRDDEIALLKEQIDALTAERDEWEAAVAEMQNGVLVNEAGGADVGQPQTRNAASGGNSNDSLSRRNRNISARESLNAMFVHNDRSAKQMRTAFWSESLGTEQGTTGVANGGAPPADVSDVPMIAPAAEDDEDDFPVHVSGIYEGHKDVGDGVTSPSRNEVKSEVDDGPSRQDVVAANKARVETMRDLRDAHKEMEKIRHQTTRQAQKLQRELDDAHAEIAKSKSALEDKEATLVRLKDDNERRCKGLETQIAKLKANVKDMQKLADEKEALEGKNADLREDLAKAESRVGALKKRLKEEAEKLAETESRKAKEVFSLRKQIEEDAKRIRLLETQGDTLRRRLDRAKSATAATSADRTAQHAARRDTRSASAAHPTKNSTVGSLPPIAQGRAKAGDIPETGDMLEEVQEMEESLQSRAEEIEAFKEYHAFSKHLRQVRTAVAQLTADLKEGESILETLAPEDPMRQRVGVRVGEIRQERELEPVSPGTWQRQPRVRFVGRAGRVSGSTGHYPCSREIGLLLSQSGSGASR